MNGWNKLLLRPDLPSPESPLENPISSVNDTAEIGELFYSLGQSHGDDTWQSPEDWLNEDGQIMAMSCWMMKEL